uniref:Solute carrier family 15 member 1 n=1 Tax=Leptobrachium leishanense TaxID=445787 RepID=A0A8C5LZJ9_9ANUR
MSKLTGQRIPGCFGYPLSIFFIVINEFCERFSYYGMRAVLVLYFKYFIQWDDNLSTVIYHTFVAVCYLTPILGAIIADSWLGKFKTIVYLSIVYAAGQVVLSISAIHDLTDHNRDGIPDDMNVPVALSMTGLLLIALGTGGIKPCVSAFGGDQFDETQDKQRSRFFSIFYLSINAGSLLSTIITPILRGQECGIYTKQKCYPLAFGVPAALMVVALIVFIIGSSMYKKVAPQGNIIVKVSKCIGFAISNRFKNRSKSIPKREHWMDWAKEKYEERLIAQIKMVVRVLFLYIPLPMFWALFDQQGSRWTLQATTMDGNFGAIQIQPDQMQTVNPILIIVLVPVVDILVYPLIKKCKLNFTPLKRMTVGMFLAAMAFIAAALVQVEIDVSELMFKTEIEKPIASRSIYPECITTFSSISVWQIRSVYLPRYVLYRHIYIYDGHNRIFSFFLNQCSSVLDIKYIEDIKPNTVHMALQIPQYFLMTAGEVVFSVTGLEFSYSQAPSNMKSVLQAGWLLTVAFGNILVLIIAGASHITLQWAEYVLFAALLLAVCVIFAVMSYFYTYIDPTEIEAQFDKKDEKKKDKEKEALGYEIGDGPYSQTKM